MAVTRRSPARTSHVRRQCLAVGERGVKRALIREPSPQLAQGLVAHIERQAVDFDMARKQWDLYVRSLETHGWETVAVPPAADCPDSVFIEDPVVVYGSLAVITRSGEPSRRRETEAVEPVMSALGYALERITGPAILDGGDVLKVGNTVYVGRGRRTNAEGVRQLGAVLAPMGATVIPVPVTKVLHLKSAVTALPDGTVIGFAPLVDDPALFDRFLPVPEESGSHVVDLGEGRVLMAADCPESTALIASLGYEPVLVDISEFEKLEGCVTCLSVRLRTSPR